jgi:hypothetical protein
MKKMLFVCALGLSVQVFGALPPLYQSVAELKAILEDKRLGEQLNSAQVIQQIMRIEGGYDIRTQDYVLQIDVRALPSTRPGPQRFELHFNDATSLNQNVP